MKDIYDLLPLMFRVNTIFEIGCHRMVDTERMRGLFQEAVFHCVEPDPRNVAFVESEGLIYKLNVHFYPVALSNQDGRALFYLSTNLSDDPKNEWTASSSLRKPSNFGSKESLAISPAFFNPDPVEVVCRSLDSLCDQHGIKEIDFIWMDAQGCENLIIEGGQNAFSKTRFLFTEHNTCGVYTGATDFDGLRKLLPHWKVIGMWPYDVLLENTQLK